MYYVLVVLLDTPCSNSQRAALNSLCQFSERSSHNALLLACFDSWSVLTPQVECVRVIDQKRPFFVVFDYERVQTLPPPFVVTWESEILGRYFNFVVDAMGLETGFTLEIYRKRVKEKLKLLERT